MKRYMRTISAIVGVTIICGAAQPDGCAGLTDQEKGYLQKDFGYACDAIAVLDPQVRANFNGNVQVALTDLEYFCPPNPPPTDPMQVAIDIAKVATSLAPYIKSAVAKNALANAKSIAAAHGVAPPQ